MDPTKRTNFSVESAVCCNSAEAACPVSLPPRPGRNSTQDAFLFTHDPDRKRTNMTKCNVTSHGTEMEMHACCPVVESSRKFKTLGFETRTSPLGHPEFHWLMGWPYGGFGYMLSKGLLRAIGRDNWEECARRIPCEHADQQVTTCIFNHGFLPTIVRYNMNHGPDNVIRKEPWKRLSQAAGLKTQYKKTVVQIPSRACHAKGGICGKRDVRPNAPGNGRAGGCACHLPD